MRRNISNLIEPGEEVRGRFPGAGDFLQAAGTRLGREFGPAASPWGGEMIPRRCCEGQVSPALHTMVQKRTRRGARGCAHAPRLGTAPSRGEQGRRGHGALPAPRMPSRIAPGVAAAGCGSACSTSCKRPALRWLRVHDPHEVGDRGYGTPRAVRSERDASCDARQVARSGWRLAALGKTGPAGRATRTASEYGSPLTHHDVDTGPDSGCLPHRGHWIRSGTRRGRPFGALTTRRYR